MQPFSCTPHCLCGYYICPVYCGFCADPLTPSAALLCSGLCNSETDLNTVSTVIVPLAAQRTLKQHLSSVSPLLSSESPGWPVQLDDQSFFWPSQGSTQTNPPRLNRAHTYENAVQHDILPVKTTFVQFIIYILIVFVVEDVSERRWLNFMVNFGAIIAVVLYWVELCYEVLCGPRTQKTLLCLSIYCIVYYCIN